MKFNWSFLFVGLILLLTNCSDDDDESTPAPGGSGIGEAIATYSLTLETNFTEATHPTDFPSGAMFGPLFGIAHGNETTLFRQNQIISDGFRAYVENGDTQTLSVELTPNDDETAEENFAIDINTTGAIGPENSMSFEISVTPDTTFLSFAAVLNPSPDWFIGIDSFDLLGGNNVLIEEATMDLFPLDAGFNDGATYTEEGSSENNGVSVITGDPFIADPNLPFINPLATLTITRID